MAIVDPRANFARSNVNQGYNASATTITIDPNDPNLSRWPSPTLRAYNAVWWNSTTYPDATDDPNVEVVRVTAISGAGNNDFTITRGQEGTAATNKNSSGSTYKLQLSYTAKLADDLDAGSVDVGAETVWVTENGAAGDGTTNDTAAITTSIAAGNHLIFPPGTYLVDGDITITKNNLLLEGRGIGISTIKIKDTSTGVTSCFALSNVANVTFRGLTIDGNKANNAGEAYDGINVGGTSTNIRIESCEINQCRTNGLFLDADDCYAVDSLFDANDASGVRVLGDDALFYGCRMRNNATGITLNATANQATFDSCFLSGNGVNLTDNTSTSPAFNHTRPSLP
jgi:hypothetical protein